MKTIIFDLDGVLIPATEWHYEALNKALIECGYPALGRTDHVKIYNGLPTRQKLKIMGIEDPRIIPLKNLYTSQIIKEKCKPDTAKILLLKSLSKSYNIACCSNAIKKSVVDMLTRAKLHKYISLVLGNDDIKNPKPDPEIYLTAMKHMGINPEDCLIVEDAPHGIEAAKTSGALTIAVRGYEDVNINLFRRLQWL